jgi:hypothetical protein
MNERKLLRAERERRQGRALFRRVCNRTQKSFLESSYKLLVVITIIDLLAYLSEKIQSKVLNYSGPIRAHY